jgi:hypothetical protein
VRFLRKGLPPSGDDGGYAISRTSHIFDPTSTTRIKHPAGWEFQNAFPEYAQRLPLKENQRCDYSWLVEITQV